MQHTYSDILSDILTIINYPNKEKAISEFERLNHLDTLMNIFSTFPYDMQKVIKHYNTDPETIKKSVDQDIYMKELTKVSESALIKLTEAISPTLTSEQSEQILQLIASYENHK